MYEHRCLENINKLYKSAGKCDDQQKYKVILEAYIVSTPEGLVDNILMDVSTSGTLKNPSARKSRSRFLALLDIIQKNECTQNGSSKKKRYYIWTVSALWYISNRHRGHTKLHENFKQALYNCTLHHTCFVQSPIDNCWHRVSIDGHTKKNL